MNKKILYPVLVIAAGIIIGLIWRYESKVPAESSANPDQNSTAAQNISIPAKSSTTGSNVWQGTLKASDNSKKGNLMLVTDKSTIYIYTSRDYSNLIGQQVNVSYEGTLNNFVLGDITPK